MAYAAYEAQHCGAEFSFENRNETRGILGTFAATTDPIATAVTLDELRQKARAYLGDHPDAMLYLVDSESLVHEILTNKQYYAAIDRLQRYVAMSLTILVFCVTCLVGTAVGGVGVWGLAYFGGVSILYVGTVRLGIYNEVEGAVACEILLILSLILLPLPGRLMGYS